MEKPAPAIGYVDFLCKGRLSTAKGITQKYRFEKIKDKYKLMLAKLLTFSYNLCIINIGNDKSTNVVLPIKSKKFTSKSSNYRCEFFLFM